MSCTRHCARRSGLWLGVSVLLLVSGCMSTPTDTQAPTKKQTTPDRAGPGQTPPPKPPGIPAEFARPIDYARTIGSLLYRHERAAERANAVLHARNATAPPDDLGWVTEQVDGQGTLQVTFVAGPQREPGRWQAWSRVLVRAASAATAPSTDATAAGADQLLTQTLPALSPFERNKLSARLTALAAEASGCGTNMRVVVIAWRRAGQDIFLAYRLSDSANTQQVLLGSQHEFVLDARGQRLLQLNTSEPGCSTIPRGAHGATLARSSATQTTPTLFDVYVSLREARPMQLTTLLNNLRWQVDGDGVRLRSSSSSTDSAQASEAP